MNGARARLLHDPVDLLELHARQPDRYPFLLESVSSASTSDGLQGRYDLLLGFPAASLCLEAGRLTASGFSVEGADFLANLDRWFRQEAKRADPHDLPFLGGWFLFLGYELAGQIEPILRLPADPVEFPTALAVRCPAAIIHDHEHGQSWLIAEPGQENLMAAMAEDVARPMPQRSSVTASIAAQLEEEPAERFVNAVDRIREYIRAGDVFQVNLSRRWQVNLAESTDPSVLYRRLRQTNPAPFAGLMRWHDSAVICSSPERLVRSRAGIVETRPIAGTRPRFPGQAADIAQSRELLAHPKERAEHIMLIDLERNDLGRICEPGSVQVNELMTLESYTHVHHIVSNVQGRLRKEVGPGEIIRAVFPGGTITGCPKVRCMEIIAELEGQGRGAYTGSMGYLDRSGMLDLNILIRSLVVQGDSGWFRTGAGIVADSDPLHELEETRAKARGLLRIFEDHP